MIPRIAKFCDSRFCQVTVNPGPSYATNMELVRKKTRKDKTQLKQLKEGKDGGKDEIEVKCLGKLEIHTFRG